MQQVVLFGSSLFFAAFFRIFPHFFRTFPHFFIFRFTAFFPPPCTTTIGEEVEWRPLLLYANHLGDHVPATLKIYENSRDRLDKTQVRCMVRAVHAFPYWTFENWGHLPVWASSCDRSAYIFLSKGMSLKGIWSPHLSGAVK